MYICYDVSGFGVLSAGGWLPLIPPIPPRPPMLNPGIITI